MVGILKPRLNFKSKVDHLPLGPIASKAIPKKERDDLIHAPSTIPYFLIDDNVQSTTVSLAFNSDWFRRQFKFNPTIPTTILSILSI
jgi:hypothetical protein